MLTLWEADIDRLTTNNCYSMKRLLVRVFQEVHYLSLPANGAIITLVEHVPDDIDNIDTIEPSIEDAEITAIKEIQHYKMCVVCHCKVIPDDTNIGTCQKCFIIQKLSMCTANLIAKFIDIGSTKSHESLTVTLTAYGDLLKSIMEGVQDITPTTLLNVL